MNDRAKILVVDDEDRFRENMIRLLAKAGHEALGARNGKQALEMLEATKFDLVLLDLMMPDLSGHATFLSMAERGDTASVVVLTGHASLESTREMLDLGAFDVLLKPVDSFEIIKKVEQVLEQRKIHGK